MEQKYRVRATNRRTHKEVELTIIGRPSLILRNLVSQGYFDIYFNNTRMET